MYYLWATLLILANGLAWLSNVFTIPGTWFLIALTALFAWFFPENGEPGISWWTIGILIGLALLGELIEFAAGAAGAARRGASFRGMALAVLGALLGSVSGALVTLPIPLAPLVGALLGGAGGAFAGAYIGESWKGRSADESFEVGKAAFFGRILGTVGKIAVGAVMWAVAAVDALLV